MNESTNNKHMVKSTSTYIDQLLENHSKIQVIRLDLSYTKEHAREASLEEINQAVGNVFSGQAPDLKTVFDDSRLLAIAQAIAG